VEPIIKKRGRKGGKKGKERGKEGEKIEGGGIEKKEEGDPKMLKR
jgi:hypothetical protein